MIDQITNIINTARFFFIHLGNTPQIEFLKWLGTILTFIFGGMVIFLIAKLEIFKKIFKTTGNFLLTGAFPKRHLNKSWQNILSRLNKNDEASLKLALIEADNIFDSLLKQMGLPGESMADRLKYINSAQISNIDEIWQAHKLRNQIVHNHEISISRSEMEFGVRAYEKALKELEYID